MCATDLAILVSGFAQLQRQAKLRNLVGIVSSRHCTFASHLVAIESDSVHIVLCGIDGANVEVLAQQRAAKDVVDGRQYAFVAANPLPQMQDVVTSGQIVFVLSQTIEREKGEAGVDLVVVDVLDAL
jgi:hypothetical protein